MEKRSLFFKVLLPVACVVICLGIALGVYFGVYYRKPVQFLAPPESNKNPILSEDEKLLKLFDFTECRIDGVNGYMVRSKVQNQGSELNLPSEYRGLPVLAVASSGFSNHNEIKKLVVPDSYVDIGVAAFKSCTGITSFNLPSNLKEVGDWAFQNCSGISYLRLPASVNRLGTQAFSNCANIKEVIVEKFPNFVRGSVFENCPVETLTINSGNRVHNMGIVSMNNLNLGSGITAIRRQGFNNLTNLVSLKILSSNIEFDYGTFTGCDSLENITLSNQMTKVPANIFSGLISLKNITLPDTIEVIEYGAFQGCSNLKNINIPENVKSIQASAFGGCTSLESIILPNSITILESQVFTNCTSLSSITLPENLITIRTSAFNGCSNLKQIEIPQSVTEIGNSVFSGCTSLISIVFDSQCSINVLPYNLFADCSSLKVVIVPDSVTKIESSVFKNCSSLTNIYMPNGILEIGGGTFSGCSALVYITLPEALTEISYALFSDCVSLKGIEIREGIISIGSSAFNNCTSLTKIVLPKSLTALEYRSFSGCVNLSTVIMNNFVSGSDSFESCPVNNLTINAGENVSWPYLKTSIISLTLGNEVTSIANYAFRGCKALRTITFGNGLKTIGDYAFQYCEQLSAIYLPEGLLSVGYDCFDGCKNVLSISIPSTLTSMSYKNFSSNSFSGCSEKLETISVAEGNAKFSSKNNCLLAENDSYLILGCKDSIIPNTVTNIDVAFQNCIGLLDLLIPRSVYSINSYAFFGCINLKSIEVLGDGGYLSSKGNCLLSYYGKNLILGCKNSVIPNGVEMIYPRAFYGCEGLKSIVIPEGVTNIGDWAFQNCKDLNSISFPSTVSTISEYAFYNCGEYLSEITIAPGNSVYYVQNNCLIKNEGSAKTLVLGCGDATIPEDVTIIGYAAFCNRKELASIVIPDSVQTINIYGFKNCTSLNSVTIGMGLENINDSAFEGCISLSTITIPNNVKNIGSAFIGCSSLKEVIIQQYYSSWDLFKECPVEKLVINSGNNVSCKVPKDSLKTLVLGSGVLSTGDYSFNYCPNLETVILSEGLTSIGYESFRECTKLSSITLPSTLNKIGRYSFMDTGITSIIIPENVNIIESWAFSNTNIEEVTLNNFTSDISDYAFPSVALKKLTINSGQNVKKVGALIETLILGEGVTSLAESAFGYCSNLKSVTILSNSLTNISKRAFEDCKNLTNIELPEGVITIEELAFNGAGLKSISMPSSLAKIDIHAFQNCKLDNIFVDSENKIYSAKNNCLLTNYNKKLVMGCGKNVIVPDGVTIIGSRAFAYSDLESIQIPASVREIGEYAFIECVNLNIVMFNDYENSKCTTIGDSAFMYCSKLSYVKIPNTVSDLGESAFAFCESLEEIILSNKLTIIKKNTFVRCTSLMSINLPKNLMEIGLAAFNYCRSLESLYIPKSLTKIIMSNDIDSWDYNFLNCCNLKFITVEEGNAIYKSVNNHLLTIDGKTLVLAGEGEIPSSVTTIGKCAFSGRSFITEISIPLGVTTIEDYAFYCCTNLTKITFSEILASIGNSALGATGIESICLPKTLTEVGYIFSSDMSAPSTPIKQIEFASGFVFDEKISGLLMADIFIILDKNIDAVKSALNLINQNEWYASSMTIKLDSSLEPDINSADYLFTIEYID